MKKTTDKVHEWLTDDSALSLILVQNYVVVHF